MENLKRFVSQWRKISNDRFVLDSITGFKFKFDERPIQTIPPRI